MNGQSRPASASDRVRGVVALASAALAVLVYANSLANGFAYDDGWIIASRELVHGLGRLPELLASDYWPDPFGSGLYRPLTLLTYALDWQLWGGAPFGFHLFNVLLHAAVSAVVALLLLRWFPWWAALAGAVVFAVHPVHSEAVANVVGRAELLAALPMLTACLVYVRASEAGAISEKAIAAIALCYGLALLSKEVGVVLPGLLLLLDMREVSRRGAERPRRYVRSRLPLLSVLAALLVAYLGIRWLALGAPLQGVVDRAFEADSSFVTRASTMARVWPRYFELLLFPTKLSADYSPAVILPVRGLTPLGAVGLLLIGSTLALGLASIRRAPEFLVAVGWAGLALLPVSNLVFVAEIVLAERTLYLPSVAVSLAVATALARATPRWRGVLGVGLALWVVAFSMVTVKRNPVWKSTGTVFADLQRNHPESSRLLWWLGEQRLSGGDWPGAKAWFYRSLEVWPHHAAYLAQFAVALNQHGELEEAERVATAALTLQPSNANLHGLVALVRLRRGDYEGVLEATGAAIRLVGDGPPLRALEADAYSGLGDQRRAALAQAALVRLRGDSAAWQDWYKLAALRAAAGDTAGALVALDSLGYLPVANREAADSLRAELVGLR